MAPQNYDREYERYLNLARRLIWKIKDKSDRGIALKYVNLLARMKTDEALVKKNRNAFFKYFIGVLEDQLNNEAKTRIQCTCPTPNEWLILYNEWGLSWTMDSSDVQLWPPAGDKLAKHLEFLQREGLSDPLKFLQKEVMSGSEKMVCNWSKDRRSYISAKMLPGRGALLYMAVSSKGNEWDVRGQQKTG